MASDRASGPGRGALVPWWRRLLAAVALLAYAAALVLVPVVLVQDVPVLVGVVVAGIVAVLAAWWVLTRRGVARIAALAVALVALGAVVFLLLRVQSVIGPLVALALLGAATGSARLAVGARPRGDHGASRPGGPPGHPVLFINPRSGDGKPAQHDLAGEAARRGIEAVELQEGDDLTEVAQQAVADGADALGMAGGDGSQALLAAVAIEHDLPYVCVPAGTRNHFALDLGVDRDDPVGSLDAFHHGVEHRVDVAWVGDRLFVNNASMGIYAEVVQSPEYRDAKLSTTAQLLPELLGPDATPLEVEFTGPDGEPADAIDLLLVSNNVYELEGPGAFGGRQRLDEGVLGIVTLRVGSALDAAGLVALQATSGMHQFDGWQRWTATELEVRSAVPLQVGIDGEALTLDAPLRFRIDPGALRVRVAPHHPGVSPARLKIRLDRYSLLRLVQIAATGADPKVAPSTPGRPDPS